MSQSERVESSSVNSLVDSESSLAPSDRHFWNLLPPQPTSPCTAPPSSHSVATARYYYPPGARTARSHGQPSSALIDLIGGVRSCRDRLRSRRTGHSGGSRREQRGCGCTWRSSEAPTEWPGRERLLFPRRTARRAGWGARGRHRIPERGQAEEGQGVLCREA